MKKLILISFLLITAYVVSGQQMSNFRNAEFKEVSDTICIDTMSIIPGSVIFYDAGGNIINDSLFTIDYGQALIIPQSKNSFTEIKITWRSMPYNLTKELFHKDYDLVSDINNKTSDPYKFDYDKTDSDDFFARDELNKRGSISRGITFGNNQDIIVNSNLNLQLSGKISDNLNIMAAISDNNIPIQPDGNSQQIQEFDKVYIKIFNKKTQLIVGDIEIFKPTGQFMNLRKKAQGGLFSSSFNLSKKKERNLTTTVSGAIAKGKYCRQPLSGQEGNQGPYRIKGCNGEAYIIILAGTEKVYIDGRLMKRGLENDYVIDYNTAEVTFTPAMPITKDKRIIVEFEYSDRNYARFLVFNSNEFRTENTHLWLNLYSESDAKNQPINQQLNDEQKQKMYDIGDSLNLAVVYNIKDTVFTNDLVLYKKTDTTLTDGTLFDSIYMYSTNPDSAIYKLGFSYVGEFNGNYMLDTASVANGKVHKWIAPADGVPMGNYEPVVLLITPKKKQMVSFGGDLKLGKTTSINFEGSMSNNDLNSFSPHNSNDDLGYAVKFKIIQGIPLKDSASSLNTSVSYQLVDRYFSPIERFRNPEFERDWNLGDDNSQSNEHLLNFNMGFLKAKSGKAIYNLDYMNRESGYSAMKNSLNGSFDFKGFHLLYDGSYLYSDDPVNKTRFFRQKAQLSKEIKFITLGVRELQEDNKWFNTGTDSLMTNSFSFTQWEFFVNNADTAKRRFFAKYTHRKDYMYKPLEDNLKYATKGEDINVGVKLLKNRKNTFNASVNYRRLSVIDTMLTDNNKENTVVGRIEHSLKLFKGALTTSTLYEIGSGLEMKKEFSYIKVAQGQGVYKWIDYDGDDIKELDEFEIAIHQDEKEYIRVFTPTNEYIKTYTNQFNQLINLKPVRIWRNKKGFRKFIARFSDQFAYRIKRKDTQNDILASANPFTNSIKDTNLVSIASSIRNSFSFNKTNSVIGVDYIYQQHKNRILMLNGMDTRTNQMNSIMLRWNITKKFTFINNFTIGEKEYSSQFFVDKNYLLAYYSDESKISFQPNMSFRISLIYSYKDKNNRLETESSYEHKAGMEIKYNVVSKSSLSASIDYIKLNYNADLNTPVAYEMLQGFLPGNNATWTVMFNRSISKNLQMNLNYTGRISESAAAVHTGGLQLRASF